MAPISMPGHPGATVPFEISPAREIQSGEVPSPREIATQFDRFIRIKRCREAMEGGITDDQFVEGIERPFKILCQLSGLDCLENDRLLKKLDDVDAKMNGLKDEMNKELAAKMDDFKNTYDARIQDLNKERDARMNEFEQKQESKFLDFEKRATLIFEDFQQQIELKVERGCSKIETATMEILSDMKRELASGIYRIYNVMSQMEIEGNGKLWPLPKSISGHPYVNPPSGVLEASYVLGSLPPDGVFPKTLRSVRFSSEEEIIPMIKNMNWFYNDPILDPENKSPSRCRAIVERFIKFA